MKPFKHPECNTDLSGGAPHIPDLHIKREEEDGFITVTSYWKPSKEELTALLNGGSVELCVMGESHPPVSIRANLK